MEINLGQASLDGPTGAVTMLGMDKALANLSDLARTAYIATGAAIVSAFAALVAVLARP